MTDEHTQTFKLPRSVTLSNCEELKLAVVETLADCEQMDLDSSEVKTIDTAGIQFIHSLCLSDKCRSHSLVSDGVKEAMQELGLELS